MLDGTADADGHVEVWCNNLAGLTNLHIVGDVAGVDGGARGTYRTVLAAEGICEFVEHFEVLAIL